MKKFCPLVYLMFFGTLCQSAPQFNNFNLGGFIFLLRLVENALLIKITLYILIDEVCKEFEVKGGSSQTNGIYTRDNIDPNIWKKLTDNRVIFNNYDDNGWKIGTEGQSLYGTSYYFKSKGL